MTGTIIFFVVGLVLMCAGIPLGMVLGAFVGAMFRDDHAVGGARIGWVFGLLIAVGGLLLAVFRGIDIVVFIVQQTHG